jgi:hypothetical protein
MFRDEFPPDFKKFDFGINMTESTKPTQPTLYVQTRRADLPPELAANACLGESLDEFLENEGLLADIREQERLRAYPQKAMVSQTTQKPTT